MKPMKPEKPMQPASRLDDSTMDEFSAGAVEKEEVAKARTCPHTNVIQVGNGFLCTDCQTMIFV